MLSRFRRVRRSIFRFQAVEQHVLAAKWHISFCFIVGGHIGYPWTEEMIAVCRKHENVYIDTSAYVPRRFPPELVKYMASRGGRRKVLFGTNFPMIGHAQALDGLDDLGLDDETRRLFLHANAERLLNLPGTDSAIPA